MENRIESLIKNIDNVRVSKERKETLLEDFVQTLTNNLVKMNNTIIKIGGDTHLSLLPGNEQTKKIILTDIKDEELYSVAINKEAQILNISYAKELVKTYYISLNEGFFLEDIYNKNIISLEDILMIDLKRIIESNNF